MLDYGRTRGKIRPRAVASSRGSQGPYSLAPRCHFEEELASGPRRNCDATPLRKSLLIPSWRTTDEWTFSLSLRTCARHVLKLRIGDATRSATGRLLLDAAGHHRCTARLQTLSSA